MLTVDTAAFQASGDIRYGYKVLRQGVYGRECGVDAAGSHWPVGLHSRRAAFPAGKI